MFYWIEAMGLKVDPKLFEEHFGVEKEWTYSQFNLKNDYNKTFKLVWWSKLCCPRIKKSGCREAFVPDNDFLLEIDI